MKVAFSHLILILCASILMFGCETVVKRDYGNLTYKTKLSELLEEVSGIQYDAQEDAFWMINDSGNAPEVFLVKETGKIVRVLKIDAKNHDWEDITMDMEGNLYIGDFGNNRNERKNLRILKIDKNDLQKKGKIKVKKIKFSFPEQTEFPPKDKYFDVEGFFERGGNFYVFTKSRVKNEIGRTFLYKVPNKKGKHDAQRISDFTTCPEEYCWITAADITRDGKKVVLINQKSAWIFTNFKGDDFFSGNSKEFPFKHESQLESATFKKENQLFLADEENRHGGRNLYSLQLEN